MADKDLGKRSVGSLAKASLSVRYTRHINTQSSSRAGPASAISPPSNPVPANTGVSKPTLRTVIKACPTVSMKSLLGICQDQIRIFQSPGWMIKELNNLAGENGNDPAGKKFIAAGNSLLDLCRFVEILISRVIQETVKPNHDKASTSNSKALLPEITEADRQLAKKLNDIWNDLYLAVEYLEFDSKRSGAFVRHAAVEVLNLGVELEDKHSYLDGKTRKLVSGLEMLSAGIADAYELLPRTLVRDKERSKSIKNVLSPNGSILKKSEGGKKIGIFNERSSANAELAREIEVICDAVSELIHKLSKSDQNSSETIESDQNSSEMIGMFKLCAARLNRILSLPYSLKRWELELHRAHHFFRQAARPLSTMQVIANQGNASSSGNLPYGRMANYIDVSFDDTMHLLLKKADPGYARHNFTGRKQSGPIPSARVLRSPVKTPVPGNTTVGNKSVQPRLMPSTTQTDTDSKHGGTGRPLSRAAVISPSSTQVISSRRIDADVDTKAGKDDSRNKRANNDTRPDVIRQKASTREDAPAPRHSVARAATMSVHWQELQTLSEQQRSDKKTA